jgi:hypothetical protein
MLLSVKVLTALPSKRYFLHGLLSKSDLQSERFRQYYFGADMRFSLGGVLAEQF